MGARELSEADYQNQIVEYAKFRQWMVMHSRPAINRSGRWSTPIQGHKGFPDLVLARDGITHFSEIKSRTGRASSHQMLWIGALGGLDSPFVHIWRPDDWPDVQRILK